MFSRIDLVHFVRTVNAETHYLNPLISHRGFMIYKTNLRQSILINSVDFSVKLPEKIILPKVSFEIKKIYLQIGLSPISRHHNNI